VRPIAEETFRSYLEAFNRADVPALVALYAEQTDFRNPFSPAPLTSRAAVQAFVAPMFEAYSAMQAEPDGVLVAGDCLAARLTIQARHTGELAQPAAVRPAGAQQPAGARQPARPRQPAGLIQPARAIQPTGRTVRLRTAEFLRVNSEGLIAEHERIFDSAAVLVQLGVGGAGGWAG
jgi:hypothetical protein